MTVRIAIDCMGGDHGLSTTLPAAVRFLAAEDDVHLLLVGRQDEIDQSLTKLGLEIESAPLATDGGVAGHSSRVTRVQAAEVVAMDDPPAQALRGKRDSSMRRAIELVRDGQADACVSAGNTGALMAISRFVLKMQEGIDRPAIAAPVPNARGGQTMMLDLGANVDCDPEHLLQFAVMGSALVSALGGPDRPTVGLLNIGEESIKGNETAKEAAELLRASPLNFYGNVEGDDIYKGTVDVVVCDGFVGNVALKTSEGLAKMLAGFIREEFGRTVFTRLMALLSMPVLRRLRRRVDPGRYNGASLIGLRGVVIKSHGASDSVAFEYALRRAHDSARNRLLERIGQALPRVGQA